MLSAKLPRRRTAAGSQNTVEGAGFGDVAEVQKNASCFARFLKSK